MATGGIVKWKLLPSNELCFACQGLCFLGQNQYFRCKRERCVRVIVESTLVYAAWPRVRHVPRSRAHIQPALKSVAWKWTVALKHESGNRSRGGAATASIFCYELSILNGPCAGHDNLSPIGFRNSRSLLRFWLACVHVTRGVCAMLRNVS